MKQMKEKEKEKDNFLKAFDKHVDALFHFAFLKTGDRELAKDMVQDSFVKTFEYLQKGEKVENLKAFLYKILRNMIIDYYRKKQSVSLDKHLEEGFEIEETNKESRIFEKTEEREVIETLSALEEPYKETLVLRFIEDLSVNDIAEILKVTPNVISVRINRGLEKIRMKLGVSSYTK